MSLIRYAGYEREGVSRPPRSREYFELRNKAALLATLRTAGIREAIRSGQRKGLTLREIAKVIGCDVGELQREQLRWLEGA